MFLSVVSTLHHERVNQSLDKRALNLLKASLLVATSSVWQVDLRLLGLEVDVFHKRDVFALNTLIGPFSEELNLSGKFSPHFSSFVFV